MSTIYSCYTCQLQFSIQRNGFHNVAWEHFRQNQVVEATSTESSQKEFEIKL